MGAYQQRLATQWYEFIITFRILPKFVGWDFGDPTAKSII